jgi:methanogenic corrinoid protein MtbC1
MAVDTEAPAPARVRADYQRALLAADLPAAGAVLDEALDAGLPAADIYLGVLQPTLYEIGRLWSHAELSVAQEHMATAAVQSAMVRLAGRLRDQPRRVAPGAALVACVSDALHERFA